MLPAGVGYMRIAVMGSGGVGGYFGGLLAAHGEDVTFVARGAHLLAIQDRGLEVNSTIGSFHVRDAQATDDPAKIGPVDVVMFSVKSWDTRSAAEAIRPLVAGETVVISLQNGVDNEDELAEVLGPKHVAGGVAYVTSIIASPGVIQQSGTIARLVFGELDGQRTPRMEAFYDACRAAGINAELSNDTLKAIWTKFLYICAWGGVGTLTRQPIGPVLGDPDTRELFRRVMEEAEAVARAKGVALDPDIVERHLALADSVAPGLKPSMLVDLERGNRLEVAWLNGAVARIGRQVGVETPVNTFIFAALKLLANGQGE